MPYISEVQPAQYLSFTSGFGDGWRGIVRFKGDKRVVHQTPIYDSKATASRQAGRLRARYQDHLDRTGKRWELDRWDVSQRKEIAASVRNAQGRVLHKHCREIWDTLLQFASQLDPDSTQAKLIGDVEIALEAAKEDATKRAKERFRQSLEH